MQQTRDPISILQYARISVSQATRNDTSARLGASSRSAHEGMRSTAIVLNVIMITVAMAELLQELSTRQTATHLFGRIQTAANNCITVRSATGRADIDRRQRRVVLMRSPYTAGLGWRLKSRDRLFITDRVRRICGSMSLLTRITHSSRSVINRHHWAGVRTRQSRPTDHRLRHVCIVRYYVLQLCRTFSVATDLKMRRQRGVLRN